MDELLVDARDEREVYDTDVGYLFGKLTASPPRLAGLVAEYSQAEGTDAFSQFHLYVCSALLVKYSDRLREMDFQVSTSPPLRPPALCI